MSYDREPVNPCGPDCHDGGPGACEGHRRPFVRPVFEPMLITHAQDHRCLRGTCVAAIPIARVVRRGWRAWLRDLW